MSTSPPPGAALLSPDAAARVWERAAQMDGHLPIGLPEPSAGPLARDEVVAIGTSATLSRDSLERALAEEDARAAAPPPAAPAPSNSAAAAPAPARVAVPAIVGAPAAPAPSPAPAPAVRRRRGLADAFRPNGSVSGPLLKGLVAAEILLLLGGWWLAPTVFPTPAEVAGAFQGLLTSQGLIPNLWASFTLFLEALAITTVLSLLVAYAAVLPAARPLIAFVSALRFTSMAGFVFVFTMLTPGAHALKVALLVFGMSVFFIPAMVDVVLQVPRATLDHARTLRMGEWRVVWEVIVRGNLDKALDILRNNAAMGWLMLTMVEGLVRSEGGIGALLLAQNKHFQLGAVFAIQFVVLAIGLGQDALLGWLKAILAPHAALSVEKR